MTLDIGLERQAVQGERVRMARASIKLGREKFATAVSRLMEGKTISREIVRHIEEGDRDAEVGLLVAISKLTGKRVEWLAGGSDVPSDSEIRYAPVAQLPIGRLAQPVPVLRLAS